MQEIQDIYKAYNEPLVIVNRSLQSSPHARLLVNLVIFLAAGAFLVAVLDAMRKHGLHPKIAISVYISALALLLMVDAIATAKELSDIRAKRKKLSGWIAIPLIMFLLTIYILLQQLYRWNVLHKRSARFNVVLSGFKVLVLLGITLHAGGIVFDALKNKKQKG